MRIVSIIVTLLIAGVIGYFVGLLCGMVVGTFLYWKKAEREFKDDIVLRRLDEETAWEVEIEDFE